MKQQPYYKDFKEYIELNYDEKLSKVIKKYVNENKDSVKTNYITTIIRTSYSEHKIMGVYFQEDKGIDNIKFSLAVLAYVEVYGRAGKYKNSNYDTERAEMWMRIDCTAILNNGLHNVQIIDYRDYSRKQYNANTTLSKYLLRYFSVVELDDIAEDFLNEYCPDALLHPMPLPVFDIVKKMNLKLYYAPLTDSIFGRTYFNDAEEKVYNEKGYSEDKKIEAGTVLLNRHSSFMDTIGNEETTIIHECIHWKYHKKFFELQYLLNPNKKSVSCKQVDTFINKSIEEAYDWMEWQANALSLSILLPKKTVEKVLSELKEKNVPNQIILEQLSKKFNVNQSIMRLRLIKLGYKEYIGIDNIIDNKKIKLYSFTPSSISDNQTYTIDFKDAVILYVSNKKIKELATERKIVYSDGFYVLNDKKYVNNINGINRLTDYAINHIDECCLLFDIKYLFKNKYGKEFYSYCYLCRESSNNVSYRCYNSDNPQNEKIELLAEDMRIYGEEIDDANEIIRKFNADDVDFSSAFKILVDFYGFKSHADIAKLIGQSETTVRNYLQGKSRPSKLESVLAICAGLKLYPTVSAILIEKSGFSLGAKKLEVRNCYDFLINQCYREGLENWNIRLKIANIDETIP